MMNDTNQITTSSESKVSRLLAAMFPPMPHFHQLLNDQCNVVLLGLDAFAAFMETGDQAKAKEVRRLEHEGDKLKARNIDVLNKSFSTPFDREDIYRAITAIDENLNYAKTTVREIEILGVEPDHYMLEMAKLLQKGAGSLKSGFADLKTNPSRTEHEATALRKIERNAEKIYRHAIAQLFDPERYAKDLAAQRKETGENLELLLEAMDQDRCNSVLKGLSFVMEVLRRREIYRHLSNAADHLAHAGDILHDIVIKSA